MLIFALSDSGIENTTYDDAIREPALIKEELERAIEAEDTLPPARPKRVRTPAPEEARTHIEAADEQPLAKKQKQKSPGPQ